NLSAQSLNLYCQNPGTVQDESNRNGTQTRANSAELAQQPFLMQQQGQPSMVNQSQVAQTSRSDVEYQARQRSVEINKTVSQTAGNNFDQFSNGQSSDVQVSMMTPLW